MFLSQSIQRRLLQCQEWGMGSLIKMGALIRMGALIGIGALIDENTFEGGGYSEGGAYWKEGAKSNHYGKYDYLNEIYFDSLHIYAVIRKSHESEA